MFGGAVEVAQWLEALFAHPEDLSWVPGLTSGSSQPPITSTLRDPTLLAFIDTCIHSHIPTNIHYIQLK